MARERLIAFTPWHLDAVSGSHPPHLLVTQDGVEIGEESEMTDGGFKEVKMYSDFKSPYAFLAFDPAFALEDKYRIRLKWKPFQLRVKGKGQRSQYSEYKVKYSYMDARRWANMRGGLIIRGPLKIFDTTPALIGGLFAEKHGKIRQFGNRVFELFFKRELAADEADSIAPMIASIGLSEHGYLDYLADEGLADYERAQEEAVVDQVFGVPMFYFENEPFWGYDRMGLLEQRLTEAGLRRVEPLRQAG
jgi:2-hydroxychromene-2-carboxylate isomerase